MSTRTTIARTAVLLLLGVGALSACDSPSEPKRDASGSVTESSKSDVFALEVGDCLDTASMGSGADATSDTEEIDSAGTLPCSQAHDGEIYAETKVKGSTYPAQLENQAETYCGDEFAKFVGIAYEDSTLDFTYMYPTKESWGQGDRSIQCVVLSETPVTESLKGSKL